MNLAQWILIAGFVWGLSERSVVLWKSRKVQDAVLWLIAADVAGLVVLSWA